MTIGKLNKTQVAICYLNHITNDDLVAEVKIMVPKNLELDEKEMFEKIRPDQSVIGICRGSQFLCVMNGGKLIAHISSAGYIACGVYMPNNGKFIMNLTVRNCDFLIPIINLSCIW